MITKKKKLMTYIQWALLLITVLIIVNYKVSWAYYLLGGLAILMITINLYNMSNDEMIIEISCDAEKYLNVIKKNKEKKSKSLYSLQRSFGLIHQFKLQEAKEEFANCDFTSIKNRNKFYPIYIMTKTRILFYDKDVEGIELLLKELKESGSSSEGLKEYVKVYLSILTKSNLEIIKQLKEAIPKQSHRLEIYELEYQLSKVYLEAKKYVDCEYVSEFISKKKYKIIYIELCKDIFKQANSILPKE